MNDLSLVVLGPEQALQLREEAIALLRSVRRWKLCECATPWRGTDGCCGYCGKRVSWEALVAVLQRDLDELDVIATGPCRS